jgi:hypothetical protein
MRIGDWTAARIGEIVTLAHRYENGTEFMVRGRVVGIDHSTPTLPTLRDGEWVHESITKVRLKLETGRAGFRPMVQVDLLSSFEVES